MSSSLIMSMRMPCVQGLLRSEFDIARRFVFWVLVLVVQIGHRDVEIEANA